MILVARGLLPVLIPLVTEGQLSGKQFKEHHPQAEHVAALVRLRAAGRLRRHVRTRPHSRQDPAPDAPGVAEVTEVGIILRIEQHVGGLHVQVDDALLVGTLQGLGKRADDAAGLQRSDLVLAGGQRASRHELHHDDAALVVGRGQAEAFKEGNDVRDAGIRGVLRLLARALGTIHRRAVLLQLGELEGDLDRGEVLVHGLTYPDALCSIHRSEAARAQLVAIKPVLVASIADHARRTPVVLVGGPSALTRPL